MEWWEQALAVIGILVMATIVATIAANALAWIYGRDDEG